MDQQTRNKLQNATQDTRRLLEQEFAEQLEGTYDILPDGKILPEPGKHLDDHGRLRRQKLVDAIEHIRAGGKKPAEATDEYTREAAFTFLNRFVALRMLEARAVVQQCVSKGDQSSGFKEFTGLAPGLAELPDKGYRLYLECLFDELSIEVKVLFDRRDPASLLWPRRQSLTDLLAILNQPELAGVWDQDETIGWVYQYFNGQEERRKMREESQAPRNSRELAVRNQFFTPRYVVEFLTDNTLGRIWYEMRQGNTRLKEQCRYLVRRPTEIFLKEGEQPPEQPTDENLSQEELLKQPVHIPFRPKKDPRDLKVLDPACGSGHFLLYCFDLLLTIYEEGWAHEQAPPSELAGKTLRENYATTEALREAAPALILRHNLHGIDIDARCAQIAAFALWMRAQRAYNDFGLDRASRPAIRSTNIVVAEPMPGEKDLLKEFTATLQSPLLGQVVEEIFAKMQLAGEAGSLLRIEREIRKSIRRAFGEHGELFQAIDEQQWRNAEEQLVAALGMYARQGANGLRYRRQLFADDAARGLGFIDISGQIYDVVLMNPPFGLPTRVVYEELKQAYRDTYVDLYASFVTRGAQLAARGFVGAITSRAFLMTKKLARWRSNEIVDKLDVLLDLGIGVMDDAFVEAAAYILRDKPSCNYLLAVSRRHDNDKSAPIHMEDAHAVSRSNIRSLPGSKILYQLPRPLFALLGDPDTFEPTVGTARQGMTTFDDFRFLRLRWEVPSDQIRADGLWEPLAKGGEYAKYYSDIHLLVKWNRNGDELAEVNRHVNGQVAQARQASDYFRRAGATYSKRSVKGFSARALPSGCIIGTKGPAVFSESEVSPAYIVGWLRAYPNNP